jgi:phage tail sheath protein FI
VVVIDEDGLFSGTRGTVLEKFPFVSKASDAKDDSGNNNFYKEVIANKSKYIQWASHPTTISTGTAWGSTANASAFANLTANVLSSLSGGVDGTISTANVVTAYDFFNNAEAVDISLIVSGPSDAATIPVALIATAEARKDCVVFLSPPKSNCVDNAGSETTNIKTYRDTLTSTSYAVLDSNWKYQYDKYNDVYRWVPLNGDVAGLCARTDLERDPWFSPGGLNRGIIKNVIKLAWNPTKTNRDDLYVKGINPIVSFQGEGTVLFGDKTMLSKPSAFDRINVRRLFIVLEKAIARAARFSMFEFNDQFTRAQFVALVEPFLRDVQGRRGITDFRVVCDDTNNTGEVIDRNEFIGDIYIKPARSINFIQLNFVAVRTGVSFDEVVGKF